LTGFRLGLAAFLLAVLVSGFVGTRMLERSLKDRMESALGQTFGCQARAAGFFVHWTSRTLVVDGLTLSCPMKGKGGSPVSITESSSGPVPPLVFVRRIEARFDLVSLLNRVMDLESLKIEGGKVSALSQGGQDNYRIFLSRWISGSRPAISGAATIRKISIGDTDLSLRFADQGLGVTLHAATGALKPNLFMNRFRLNIPSGSLAGEFGGRVLTFPFLKATASFAQGGVPDLDIVTRFKTGLMELEGQILSFDTEPVVSLFVRGKVPLEEIGPLLSAGSAPPEGVLTFRSYFHGRMNHLKGRAVFSSPSLHVGSVHLTDLRMILSWRPGEVLARPVRVTVDGTKITGQILADLTGAHPEAAVRLSEQGSGGLLGAFGISASGTIPLPSGTREWGDFLTRLGRLARVS